MSSIPDTGCTRTIINTAVAKRNGITYKEGGRIKLIAANGDKMKVDGTAMVQITGNETSIVTDALISRAVQDDMLISCADLIRLKAIPKGFPNAVIEECRAASEDWRKILMAEYSDVLSDELNPKLN